MKKPLYKSFAYAFRGLWIALRTERNLKIHAAILVVAVGLGIYLGLTAVEWELVVFAMGFVVASELFNTAMEIICDEAVGGKITHGVRNCKDIAAAAVLVATITAVVIGIVILVIPLVQRWF
jgi:diacylglycerol kinase